MAKQDVTMKIIISFWLLERCIITIYLFTFSKTIFKRQKAIPGVKCYLAAKVMYFYELNAFQDEAGNWDVDEDQTMKMKCDYVISAFGSGLYSDDLKSAMAPIRLNRWGTPEVDIN